MSHDDPLDFLRNKPDTLRFHLENPGVDLDTYTRRKRLALGSRLMSLKRVYLDTKYWVHLRDVSMGRATSHQHTTIFERLAELVGNNRLICPVSYSVYVELMRQSDAGTRIATARLIDKFGESCCILPPHEVLAREVMHFSRRSLSPTADLYPVAEMVGTKAAFILGDVFLQMTAKEIPPEFNLAMAKTMDDLLWSATLEEVIVQLGDRPKSPDIEEPDEIAKKLTAGKRANGDFKTFEEVFLQEVAGIVECCQETFGDLLLYLTRGYGFTGKPTADELKDGGRQVANLIYSAFKHQRITTELPGIQIPAGLHAAVRLDKNRSYKAGDCEDFRHATVALPYFNIFCTEKSLKHLLCHKPLEYDQAYKTRVVSGDEEILEALAAL